MHRALCQTQKPRRFLWIVCQMVREIWKISPRTPEAVSDHFCNFKTNIATFTPTWCCDWKAMQRWEKSRNGTSLWHFPHRSHNYLSFFSCLQMVKHYVNLAGLSEKIIYPQYQKGVTPCLTDDVWLFITTINTCMLLNVVKCVNNLVLYYKFPVIC